MIDIDSDDDGNNEGFTSAINKDLSSHAITVDADEDSNEYERVIAHVDAQMQSSEHQMHSIRCPAGHSQQQAGSSGNNIQHEQVHSTAL